MPHTKLGKWSVGSIGVFFVSLLLFFILVATGQRGGDTFFSNPVLTIPILTAGAFGVAAFVVGILAIVKQKDHAVLVYLSIVIGAVVTIFIFAELLLPH